MTTAPTPAAIEIFLQPGEVYFGDRDTRIRTLLGSCVSITFWHAGLRLGGMCHYLLPERKGDSQGRQDGRYADEALRLLFDEMRAAGTRPHDYQAKIFGGGRMFSPSAGSGRLDIGRRNIEIGQRLLQGYGLAPVSQHLAGVGHRNIIFDVATGVVWVRHGSDLVSLKDVV